MWLYKYRRELLGAQVLVFLVSFVAFFFFMIKYSVEAGNSVQVSTEISAFGSIVSALSSFGTFILLVCFLGKWRKDHLLNQASDLLLKAETNLMYLLDECWEREKVRKSVNYTEEENQFINLQIAKDISDYELAIFRFYETLPNNSVDIPDCIQCSVVSKNVKNTVHVGEGPYPDEKYEDYLEFRHTVMLAFSALRKDLPNHF